MTERIDPVLVEKVGQAIYRKNAEYEPGKRTPTAESILAEAAICAIFDELGLEELQDALRLLAAAHYDEALISDTQEIEYDDLFDRKLLAQSRNYTDEYTTYLTREGYEFVVAQLKRHWRPVEQGDADGD